MKLMGIGDEAASMIDGQIKATRVLGWKFIEMRAVEVPGFRGRTSMRFRTRRSIFRPGNWRLPAFTFTVLARPS